MLSDRDREDFLREHSRLTDVISSSGLRAQSAAISFTAAVQMDHAGLQEDARLQYHTAIDALFDAQVAQAKLERTVHTKMFSRK